MTDYLTALAAATEASATFRRIQVAYRAMQIGDAEFLAAKAVYDAANAAFDVAYAAAQVATEEPVAVVEDAQLSMPWAVTERDEEKARKAGQRAAQAYKDGSSLG